jgi:glycosyltransferase involved in cell wall biosynthesis
MNNKVILLNTAHYSLDDRVFYHQARCLKNNAYQVQIISTKENFSETFDEITINSYDDSNFTHTEKLNKIVVQLNLFCPDIIICDSPLAVIASSKYKQKHKVTIIYDITEWYPSKKNFSKEVGISKLIRFLTLSGVFLLAVLKSDGFIFGEFYKSILCKRLFFWKPALKLSYYTDRSYIQHYPLEKKNGEFKLFYSGPINKDKGIDSVIKVVQRCATIHPEIQFKLKIVGYFPTPEDTVYFNACTKNIEKNIHIEIQDALPFPEFCKTIGNTDLFLDLRIVDLENTHCLPIKLFYYLACGRPVIYSNLKSIRREIKPFNFGHLCDPTDIKTIATHISDYILNPNIYLQHAKNALNSSKAKYNWALIENDFISFINSCRDNI